MASRRKSRRLAVQALYGWDVGKMPLDEALRFRWNESDVETDLTFARLLVQGTVEKCAEIDKKIADQLEHWDIGRLKKVDLAILRVGTYSLMFHPEVPTQVTIDEAVELAKEMSTDDAYRFINGVLDGIHKRLRE